MSDAFEEIQAIKIKRNSLREKLQKRKRERHELFTLTLPTSTSTGLVTETIVSGGMSVLLCIYFYPFENNC